MVTKQQQLEWLASSWPIWYHPRGKGFMSRTAIGNFVSMIDDSHQITREEWQQEREKMQKQHDFDIGSNLKVSVAATSNGFGEMKINTLWYEREELPPIGVPVELWFGATFAYNCEFIASREHNYIVWNLDADRPDCADHLNTTFRPLRTEREKAVAQMKALCPYPGSWNSTYKAFAEALYDDGYRKVEVRPSPI